MQRNNYRGPRYKHHERSFVGGEQIEGRQAVGELLQAAKRQVHELLISEDYLKSTALRKIYTDAAGMGIVIKKVSKNELSARAGTDAHQGVIASAEPIPATSLGQLIKSSLQLSDNPFLLLLDSISDPHNVGSIIRSSLAAGAAGVILCEHESAGITPAAAKAAAGAVEYMPLAKVSRAPSAISMLKEKGFWAVGLDARGEQYLDNLPILSMPLVLVFGSEGHGISDLAKERCDVVAKIEMFGPVESLGVGAAAAVACFKVAGQRSK